MRILSSQIEAFGHLRGVSLSDLDAPVVIVQGPNEAGKSTFFEFLQTMLYGIYPTDESKHPYAPVDGGRLEGRMEIRSAGGREYAVWRRLMSAPRGELVRPDGGVTDLRNHTLPVVSHVSRDVFQAVYALSLYDLTALNEKGAWQDIQDRLLGNLTIDYIRSARHVALELDDEAASLWRPDRRGKPESDEIRRRLKELRKEASVAAERDAAARELSDRVVACAERLEMLRERRIELGARKRRIDRLAPIRDRLRLIEEARRTAGAEEEIEGLPDDPAGRLRELRERIEAVGREREVLQHAREEAEAMIRAVQPGDQSLLQAAAEIASWSKRVPALHNKMEELARLRSARVEAETRMAEKAALVLSTSDLVDIEPTLMAISRAELRQRIDAFSAAERRLEDARRERDIERRRLGDRKPTGPLLAAVFVLIAAAAGSLAVGAAVLAAVLTVAALPAGWTWYTHRAHNAEIERLGELRDLGDLSDERDARRSRLRNLLDGIPIPEERLERPDPYLANDLAELQSAAEEKTALERRYSDLEAAFETEKEALAEFLRTVDSEVPPDAVAEHPELVVSRLEEALAAARDRQNAAEAARLELERVDAALVELDDVRVVVRGQIAALEERLRSLGEADLERAAAIVVDRRAALRRAQDYESDLLREVPALHEVRLEITELEDEGVEWRLSDQEMTRLDHELEDLDREINELTAEHKGAEKDLARMLDGVTVDAIQSEEEQLVSELAEIEERRDRLALLANVVRTADRRFREEHQPDVLRRAGRMLRLITGGRYERLDYEEGTETLRVFEGASDRSHPVGPPLSQGTRDQIYLAVRLAIVDHLDEGHERLPVFLDEVFVNWDAERRSRCYDVFRDTAGRRQVFVFTCHPWLREEMESALPCTVVDLGRRGGTMTGELSQGGRELAADDESHA